MIRRPPRSTRTDTLFPTRRSSDRDQPLAALLAEGLDADGCSSVLFFEATTAAAFLAFSSTPADACVIEVGLGGRLDATNVIPAPAACGISQLGVDHQAFLGDTIEQIAAEKAGIAKPGVPIIMSRYAERVQKVVSEEVRSRGGAQAIRGVAWDAAVYEGHLHYRDGKGLLEMPLPRLPGAHQPHNDPPAVAMLRHQSHVTGPPAALRAGPGATEWPAGLQRAAPRPLSA